MPWQQTTPLPLHTHDNLTPHHIKIEEVVVAELPKALVQQTGVARATLRAATGKRALPVTQLPVQWAS